MNFYPEEEARALVIKAGLELQKKQLVSRTWGNVSARISCSRFVITPSGRAYDDLRPEDLVVVNIEDCTYDGEIKPSSEKKIHAAAYALREDISFIIHTHQFYASAVGAEGEDLPFAPCAGYGLPGTGKLRKRVAEAISENPAANAFLMKRHGALCLGKSYEDAFRIAEELEEKCREVFENRVGPWRPERKKPDFAADFLKLDYPFSAGSSELCSEVFSRRFSVSGKTLSPYLDDFAQIVGRNARCCPPSKLALRWALYERNAALVKNIGAFCVAATADDLEAVAQITEKNCAAALYVKNAQPLSQADALLQRTVYLKKYSRQK